MKILVPTTAPRRTWLLLSLLCFVVSIAIGLIIISILNRGTVNHGLTPIVQFFPLFKLMWADNPTAALWFLLRKSVFTLAHQDPRSGLNLWTYEFHTLSLLVYLITCTLLGRMLLALRQTQQTLIAYGQTFLAATLILLSMSYMTSIEHCSGATWVGFVALYGLGFDEFELYPAWQWLCALIGMALLAWQWLNQQRLRLRV
ncbi:MAG: hypothetical protein OEZ68_10190 [Gammaproteobacteria bacterium]|nr:hypothetical protein [Gammaproteobacteria bacterium]MDH5801159.1 hypothetical protein [Gammaproteobacteria bacterium]